MFKKYFIMACTGFLLSTSAQADEQKTYDLSGFTGIKASAGIDVTFKTADDYSVTAKFKGGTDEDDVKIRIDNDILKISFAYTSGKRNLNAKIAVTAPALDYARATSGANLWAENIAAGNIELHADFGGKLSISGTCQYVKSRVSSGGAIKAKNLKCLSAHVKANSGASSSVYASEAGKGHSSSGGSIRIYGQPTEQKKNKSWSGGTVTFP